ncbi:MAG: endonuclease/exonuclease/phosphatase family protein [Bacteroidales bacterium]|nr:endonuclease/exonuclease/phosphatase family protein [Bacteroidales bacterium]
MKSKGVLKVLIIVLVLGLFIVENAFTQGKKQYKVGCVAFYNLENLFDTIPGSNDVQFTPDGVNKWNYEKYNQKLDHMSTVISQIGSEMFPGGPALIGVSEIENRSVVEDLVNTPKLKASKYSFVHYESPDRRGIDVALLYRKDFFRVVSSRSVRLIRKDDTTWRSRDQLVVSGMFDNELIHIIVNHWPSRSGGEKRSQPFRQAAAELTKSIVDSIFKTDINSKIFIMGDLNDDPVNSSLTNSLTAKGNMDDVKKGELFNPMWKLFKDGTGSIAYQDTWSLFDQIIVSEPLLGSDKSTLKFFKAKVFNSPLVLQKEGQFKGYPLRTYVGNTWQGGYSDHLPVYVFILKEK